MTKRLTAQQRRWEWQQTCQKAEHRAVKDYARLCPACVEAAIAAAERDAVEWVCKDAGCNEQETASCLKRWQERADDPTPHV